MDFVTQLGIWFFDDASGSTLLISPAELCIALLFAAIVATLYFSYGSERKHRVTEEALKRIKRSS